jgi:hypothetical protein
MTATLPTFSNEESDNDKEEDLIMISKEYLEDLKYELEERARRPAGLEEWLRDHPTKVKMFSAWSVFNSRRHGPMRMNWFVAKRDELVFLPYESFIFGYDPEKAEVITKAFKEHSYLDDEDDGVVTQAHNMCALYECFTEEEIEQLKAYLKDKKELHVEQIDPPFFNSRGRVEDFAHDLWHDMNEEPGYNLPFDVHGVIFMD